MSAQHAEREVVGACITSAERLAQVRDWLLPEHFEDAWLASVYAHALTLRPDQIDPVTVAETAGGSGIDPADVIELSGSARFLGSTVGHAELILAAAKCRALQSIGRELGAMAATQGAEPAATWAQARINAVCSTAGRAGPLSAKPAMRLWHAEFERRMQANGNLIGRATPWADFNALTRGLQPGKLYVFAGRPSMGKSVVGENIHTFDSLRGGRPLAFSLEMPAYEWLDRSIASRGEVPGRYLLDPGGNWEDGELYASRVEAIMRELIKCRGMVDETPSLTLQQIEARAEREHMREALTMIVIDHLHIMGRPRKAGNDVGEIGEITSGAKRMAKRLGIPVVLLAQCSRLSTERQNKRPTMSDLRGSGSIEEDADIVALLHREDYYRQDGEPHDHLLEMNLDKFRGGQKGSVVKLQERFDQYRAEDWQGPLPSREPPKQTGRKFSRGAA